jgi:hypothetical protein
MGISTCWATKKDLIVDLLINAKAVKVDSPSITVSEYDALKFSSSGS